MRGISVTYSWVAAAACLALASSLAAAQPDSARAAAVRALAPGQQIRLDVTRAGRVQGRFVVASAMSLAVRRDDGPTEIRLPDIERLWVRGRATGTGALVGAGVGALAGAVFGALIGTVACEPVDGGDCTAAEVAALTGLVGGAGGAVVGAGIGFAIPRWRLRFP